MKKIILIIALSWIPFASFASDAHDSPLLESYQVDVNLENMDSLRNGAKLFVNYCLSCHSARFMRYNRMALDLGLTDDQLKDNLMFIADFSDNEKPNGEPKKVGDLMTVALNVKDGKKFFGTAVPDLTVVARARGPQWLYAYLNTFYLDESRPAGVNNLRFPNVGMPHVLWELDGLKKAVYETRTNEKGHEEKHIVGFEVVKQGKMTPVEYQKATNDLVNFMVYMGEPAKLKRYNIGIGVMFFLLILVILTYLLKKEYWKDIH